MRLRILLLLLVTIASILSLPSTSADYIHFYNNTSCHNDTNLFSTMYTCDGTHSYSIIQSSNEYAIKCDPRMNITPIPPTLACWWKIKQGGSQVIQHADIEYGTCYTMRYQTYHISINVNCSERIAQSKISNNNIIIISNNRTSEKNHGHTHGIHSYLIITIIIATVATFVLQ